MNYIVFDLEWNQAPSEAEIITRPLYLAGEIIQIGAVKLDDAFRVVDELRLYVMPQYYTKMHRRIASLTGIRDKDLRKNGVPFPQAYDTFRQWCGEEYAFMTWSLSDLPMLIDNMILHGIDVSSLPVCYDIQRIFGREIMRGDRRYSLNDAIEILNERGDVAHDALHDARNTVKICNHLDLELYIDEYGARVFAENSGCRKYGSHAEILADPALSHFECPWCGAQITCEGWVTQNEGYMAMGVCAEGDEFLVSLHCAKRRTGIYDVRRLIFEMSDDLWDIYQDKAERMNKAQAGV